MKGQYQVNLKMRTLNASFLSSTCRQSVTDEQKARVNTCVKHVKPLIPTSWNFKGLILKQFTVRLGEKRAVAAVALSPSEPGLSPCLGLCVHAWLRRRFGPCLLRFREPFLRSCTGLYGLLIRVASPLVSFPGLSPSWPYRFPFSVYAVPKGYRHIL